MMDLETCVFFTHCFNITVVKSVNLRCRVVRSYSFGDRRMTVGTVLLLTEGQDGASLRDIS